MSNFVKEFLDEKIAKNIMSSSHFDLYKTKEYIQNTVESNHQYSVAVGDMVGKINILISDINANIPQIKGG